MKPTLNQFVKVLLIIVFHACPICQSKNFPHETYRPDSRLLNQHWYTYYLKLIVGLKYTKLTITCTVVQTIITS